MRIYVEIFQCCALHAAVALDRLDSDPMFRNLAIEDAGDDPSGNSLD
jgi:hypothetical protein